jgi:hypothetical protein
MKLKGLAKIIEAIETLEEIVDNKIDNIEWSGDNDQRDEQQDDMFNEALDLLDRAKDELNEIQELKLDDF